MRKSIEKSIIELSLTIHLYNRFLYTLSHLFLLFSKIPTKDLLESWKRGEINEKEYREIYYRDVLSKTTPQEIYSVLERTFGGRDIVFLCYEKGFCHRHLVAEWMNSAGYEVTEYEG